MLCMSAKRVKANRHPCSSPRPCGKGDPALCQCTVSNQIYGPTNASPMASTCDERR